ncbi:MAG: energy transducer TonB, partial [Proteobacteria bacterium]|nr:energy transducer TonB [Pseudomonadota bacterium]
SGKLAYLQKNYDYIRRIILRNLSFPASARKKRLSGRIEVSFFIGKDGRVDDIRLDSSSGHALLDMNVTRAIRRSSPFPAPPDRARITLPIVFRLK